MTEHGGLARHRRAGRELLLLAVLYISYSASRLVASDAFAPARDRAGDLLQLERSLSLDVELWANQVLVSQPWLAVAASFQYATAHYVVTAVVLLWLLRRGDAAYLPARRALVLATVVALACYLLLPMAPPRLVGGYTDVLAMTSESGWWGADASAPRGLGDLTNQLAAFPSLHAGWAFWVALVLHRHGTPGWRAVGWSHAAISALVVVGTGNHWLLDVVAGWAVVGAAWWVCRREPSLGELPVNVASRVPVRA